MTSRPSTAAPILAVLAVVLVTVGLVLYPVAYVVRSTISWLVLATPTKPAVVTVNPPTGPSHMIRVYESDWEALLFKPAAYLETCLTGKAVTTSSPTKLF